MPGVSRMGDDGSGDCDGPRSLRFSVLFAPSEPEVKHVIITVVMDLSLPLRICACGMEIMRKIGRIF